MTSVRPGRRAIFDMLFALSVLGLVSYFGFAALQGQYGLARLLEIEAIELRLAADLAEVRAERAALENRVRRMSDDFLDLDLLDEQARRMFGLARPDEIVIR